MACRGAFKTRKVCAVKTRIRWHGIPRLENRAVQQDHRLGSPIRPLPQNVDSPVGALTADHVAATGGFDPHALAAHRDFAIVADPHPRAHTPHKRPPRTARCRAQHTPLLRPRLLPGRVRSHPQFPVDFLFVGMGQQLVEQRVGRFQVVNLVGGKQGRQSPLPVVVATLDLAFGLGRGRVAQGHAVEAQSGSELGEGVRGYG